MQVSGELEEPHDGQVEVVEVVDDGPEVQG